MFPYVCFNLILTEQVVKVVFSTQIGERNIGLRLSLPGPLWGLPNNAKPVYLSLSCLPLFLNFLFWNDFRYIVKLQNINSIESHMPFTQLSVIFLSYITI